MFIPTAIATTAAALPRRLWSKGRRHPIDRGLLIPNPVLFFFNSLPISTNLRLKVKKREKKAVKNDLSYLLCAINLISMNAKNKVLAGARVAPVKTLGVHTTAYMNSEIMAIISQYMPLDNQNIIEVQWGTTFVTKLNCINKQSTLRIMSLCWPST